MEVPSLHLECGRSFARHWAHQAYPRDITRSPMVRRREPIRIWRQRCASWRTHLTWVKYSHNSLPPAATGMTPFEASIGYLPPLFPSQEQEIAMPSVQLNLRRMWRETRAALLHTQDQNRRLADRQRTPTPDYKPGQKVWLNSKDIPLSVTSKKHSPRFIGLFEIEAIVNPLAVRRKLPASLRIHPTFHVSLRYCYDPIMAALPSRMCSPCLFSSCVPSPVCSVCLHVGTVCSPKAAAR